MFKRDKKLNRQFLTQFLKKISNFPDWVKEIIYMQLSEQINKDNHIAYTFATYKPILTYKGKCELDFKKSAEENFALIRAAYPWREAYFYHNITAIVPNHNFVRY